MIMKVLYLAPLPIDINKLDGVPKKIMDQANALYRHGLNVDIISYMDGKTILINVESKNVLFLGKGTSKFDVITQASKIYDSYDAFYIRYPKSDCRFISFLKKIKRNSTKKIIVEIPTYPYDAQGKESLKGKFIGFVDRLFRLQLKNYVDRIVTFTGERSIFGIETLNTVNGFDFRKVTPIDTPIDTKKNVSLIAVSAMFVLHGYDRLINGLADYYRNGGKRSITLHLVGEGNSLNMYRQLVRKGNLADHVIFHGRVFGNELYSLYEGVAVGVNSLAIHRERLEKESTLKTKEYSAMGLPIVSSSYVDAFTEVGNKNYVFMIPADESYVDIENLLTFIDGLYEKYSTKEIHNMVRTEASQVCDMLVSTKPIYNYYVQD